MTPENERKNGGLIALTVEEADWILSWGIEVGLPERGTKVEQALFVRLEEWLRRHEDTS